MPSKRPSPHAMDEAASAAAARLRPSTPRSKKRTSRSKSRGRSRDRRRSPNPNPSSRRERAADHGGSAAAPSRKSDRKPKPRSFPDSATLATAMASVAAAAAAASTAPAAGGGRGSAGAVQKLWTESDEVALLTGAVAFKDRKTFAWITSSILTRMAKSGQMFNMPLTILLIVIIELNVCICSLYLSAYEIKIIQIIGKQTISQGEGVGL